MRQLEDDKDYTEEVEKYNQRTDGYSTTIEIHDDDSLVVWLFTKNMARKKDFKNELEDIAYSIRELNDRAEWIEKQIEEMGDD